MLIAHDKKMLSKVLMNARCIAPWPTQKLDILKLYPVYPNDG